MCNYKWLLFASNEMFSLVFLVLTKWGSRTASVILDKDSVSLWISTGVLMVVERGCDSAEPVLHFHSVNKRCSCQQGFRSVSSVQLHFHFPSWSFRVLNLGSRCQGQPALTNSLMVICCLYQSLTEYPLDISTLVVHLKETITTLCPL